MDKFLYDYQRAAIEKMHNGCILCGGVGSGKSRTSLSYFFTLCGGVIGEHNIEKMMGDRILDLYIITTARKRDTLEWEKELAIFGMSTHNELNISGNTCVIDSWNNLHKYVDVKDSFFIFDEQRVVGKGQWVRSFLKVARHNKWILLSATPGDTWEDYIPVFIANGFYKNRSEFIKRHVEYSRYTKYPKVERYWNTGILLKYRNDILVDMDFKRETISHDIKVLCEYDHAAYRNALKTRWNAFKSLPITNAGELCYVLRRIANTDKQRASEACQIVRRKKRAIIFYNFDYELEILKLTDWPPNTVIAEWNGHRHDPLPKGENWVYLVQYTAGAEGWNCTTTDTIIFYSQNYSYKIMKQAAGRIDRLNTPYKDLYYYHLESLAGIDLAIKKALKEKRTFNERKDFVEA